MTLQTIGNRKIIIIYPATAVTVQLCPLATAVTAHLCTLDAKMFRGGARCARDEGDMQWADFVIF